MTTHRVYPTTHFKKKNSSAVKRTADATRKMGSERPRYTPSRKLRVSAGQYIPRNKNTAVLYPAYWAQLVYKQRSLWLAKYKYACMARESLYLAQLRQRRLAGAPISAAEIQLRPKRSLPNTAFLFAQKSRYLSRVALRENGYAFFMRRVRRRKVPKLNAARYCTHYSLARRTLALAWHYKRSTRSPLRRRKAFNLQKALRRIYAVRDRIITVRSSKVFTHKRLLSQRPGAPRNIRATAYLKLFNSLTIRWRRHHKPVPRKKTAASKKLSAARRAALKKRDLIRWIRRAKRCRTLTVRCRRQYLVHTTNYSTARRKRTSRSKRALAYIRFLRALKQKGARGGIRRAFSGTFYGSLRLLTRRPSKKLTRRVGALSVRGLLAVKKAGGKSRRRFGISRRMSLRRALTTQVASRVYTLRRLVSRHHRTATLMGRALVFTRTRLSQTSATLFAGHPVGTRGLPDVLANRCLHFANFLTAHKKQRYARPKRWWRRVRALKRYARALEAARFFSRKKLWKRLKDFRRSNHRVWFASRVAKKLRFYPTTFRQGQLRLHAYRVRSIRFAWGRTAWRKNRNIFTKGEAWATDKSWKSKVAHPTKQEGVLESFLDRAARQYCHFSSANFAVVARKRRSRRFSRQQFYTRSRHQLSWLPKYRCYQKSYLRVARGCIQPFKALRRRCAPRHTGGTTAAYRLFRNRLRATKFLISRRSGVVPGLRPLSFNATYYPYTTSLQSLPKHPTFFLPESVLSEHIDNIDTDPSDLEQLEIKAALPKIVPAAKDVPAAKAPRTPFTLNKSAATVPVKLPTKNKVSSPPRPVSVLSTVRSNPVQSKRK